MGSALGMEILKERLGYGAADKDSRRIASLAYGIVGFPKQGTLEKLLWMDGILHHLKSQKRRGFHYLGEYGVLWVFTRFWSAWGGYTTWVGFRV